MALTIAPLAAISIAAVPAQAANVSFLSFASGSCAVQSAGSNNVSTSGSCSTSQTAGGGVAGANALSLSGSGQAAASGGGMGLRFISSGSASGSYVGSLPVSWDFIVNSDYASISYNLLLETFGPSPSSQIFVLAAPPLSSVSASGTVAPGTEVIGSGAFSLSGTVTSWDVVLNVTTVGGSFLNVNIPGGSTVDINPQAATPEPASFALLGAGAVALGLLRRRKKA